MTTKNDSAPVLAKRSTQNGVELTRSAPNTDADVPSYYAVDGASVEAAAASLGMRLLSRAELRSGAVPIAEIHARGDTHSRWCVEVQS